jgi:hypothetical protein
MSISADISVKVFILTTAVLTDYADVGTQRPPGNDHRIGSHRDYPKGSHLLSKKCPMWGVTSLDRRGGAG